MTPVFADYLDDGTPRGFDYEVLHYKPRRSCTLHYRVDVGADAPRRFYGKVARDDRGGEADADGLAVIAAVTAAFLDAYARKDSQAKHWLSETDLQALTGGRARLEHK